MPRPSRRRLSTTESPCTPPAKRRAVSSSSPGPMTTPKMIRLDPTHPEGKILGLYSTYPEEGKPSRTRTSPRGSNGDLETETPLVEGVVAEKLLATRVGSPEQPAAAPCSRVLSYEGATPGGARTPQGRSGSPGGSIEEASCSDSLSQLPTTSAGREALRAVKAVLHLSADVDTAVCREAESARVEEMCRTCIVERTSGSLYISGCPGTGKSLAVTRVARSVSNWCSEVGQPQVTVVTVNCMTLTDPRQIFPKILSDLRRSGIAAKTRRTGARPEGVEELREALRARSGRGLVMIVIDEMDHLITKDQSVLYQIFGFSNVPDANCFIIGIANAVDLTDRFLPKLHALKCHPDVVTFPAYNKDQVLAILQHRLKDLPIAPFDRLALELCSRKVAAVTGDMRRALDICRIALEMVEAEACNDERAEATDWTTRKVTISHMAQALSATLKSPVVETIQSLPQHQQLTLCSAVRLFGRGKKDATLGEVNNAYLSLCRASAVQPLTTSEFGGVCMVLAEQGLLNLGASREERKRRVTLKIHRDDVEFALQGVRFFRNILASCSEPLRGA